ncbi:MAG: hypothetical protein F6K11_00810 [Leptolyngbya sp. SIO3F4]|nr:hypothetical protein [Leptolyngbya sp. SIO3F4]
MKTSVRDPIYEQITERMPENFTGTFSDMLLVVLTQLDTLEKVVTQLQPKTSIPERQSYQVVSVLAPAQKSA